MKDYIQKELEAEFRGLFQPETIEIISKLATEMERRFQPGAKLLVFGNGGCMSIAEQIATGFVARFNKELEPHPALALGSNKVLLTTNANNKGYEEVFAAELATWGDGGDMALGLSTSGNSANVVKALETAREKKLFTIGLTGPAGGKMKELVDLWLGIPGNRPGMIERRIAAVGNLLCNLVK